MIGKNELASELNEQENIWRPATKYTEKHHHSIWPEHFRFGELTAPAVGFEMKL